MISPLLSNIYLHVLDTVWTRRCAHLGVLVRYADDFVVMCDTRTACEQAEQRVRDDPRAARAGAAPGQDEDESISRGDSEGFDFLGCHLRKRMSGPIWEKQRQAGLLPPAMAVAARDEAGAAAREGADAPRRGVTGRARDHRAS